MADIEIIVKIPEEEYKILKEYISNEDSKKVGFSNLADAYKAIGFPNLGDILAKYIIDGTPIPDNATNSDVMLAMFPDETDLHTFARHNKVAWWNAPYQKGGKVEVN